MKEYLESSVSIDWRHPDVAAKAAELAAGCESQFMVVSRCFEFVRDSIKHSGDHLLNPVTCRASDVLRHGTGFCYAKSHLLAALLRANGIPAGLCYQRLAIAAEGPPFCVHGLNAVYLENHGWYRIDPRGNKSGVDARFTPPVERLAFSPTGPGERDLPEIWSEPWPLIIETLTRYGSVEEVMDNLPDVENYVGSASGSIARYAPDARASSARYPMSRR